MSDTSRQSLGDRISAAITPDSLKSDERVAQEQMRGKVDKAQAYAQPESEKSYMQKSADMMRDATEGSNATGMRSSSSGSDTGIMGGGSGASSSTTRTSTSTTTASSGDNDKGLFEKAKEAMGFGGTSSSGSTST